MDVQDGKALEEYLELSTEAIEDLTQWMQFQKLADAAVAVDFEGPKKHEDFFSEDQWRLTNEYGSWFLTKLFSDNARNLMSARILRKPLEVMQSKIDAMLDPSSVSQAEKDLKYVVYSAHDTQVVNMMEFLKKPVDGTIYAMNVFFELSYSTECLNEGFSKNEAESKCFGVSVAYNGEPLLLDGCTGDNFTLEGCSYTEFVNYMSKVWYSGESVDNLDTACAQSV